MAQGRTIVSNWTHYVHDPSFSAQQLYEVLEAAIANLQLAGVSTRRVNKKEDVGFLSNTVREHLEVLIEPQYTSFIIYAALSSSPKPQPP